MNRLLMIALGGLLAWPALAQRNQLQLIRISDDNDGLSIRRDISDREYTNGTQIDVFYTKNTRPKLLSRLLIALNTPSGQSAEAQPGVAQPGVAQPENLYGIGLTQLMYTPTDINKKDILRGDRPYTAVLYGTHSLTSSDPVRHQRLTTELGLGVLGKAAMGEETQTWIHEQLGFNTPMGWKHQLPTDIVVNYLIQYEKRLIQPAPKLEILGLISTNVGTLTNNVNAGVTVRAGVFNDYFSNYNQPGVRKGASQLPNYRKFQFFVFMRPQVRLVADDSILQGGLFTRHRADYVLNHDQINRGYLQVEYGFVLAYNRLGISYSEKLITPQFKNASSQQVGNISFFVGL